MYMGKRIGKVQLIKHFLLLGLDKQVSTFKYQVLKLGTWVHILASHVPVLSLSFPSESEKNKSDAVYGLFFYSLPF